VELVKLREACFRAIIGMRTCLGFQGEADTVEALLEEVYVAKAFKEERYIQYALQGHLYPVLP
jgi:hypothetical protein